MCKCEVNSPKWNWPYINQNFCSFSALNTLSETYTWIIVITTTTILAVTNLLKSTDGFTWIVWLSTTYKTFTFTERYNWATRGHGSMDRTPASSLGSTSSGTACPSCLGFLMAGLIVWQSDAWTRWANSTCFNHFLVRYLPILPFSVELNSIIK